MTYRFKKN